MNSKFNSQNLSAESGSDRDHEGEDKLSKNNDEKSD